MKVNAAHGRKAPGRIEIHADEAGLTAHAGLAITGELARRIGLVGLLDGEIAANRRAAPVKQRERGASPGELLTAIAEAQLAGAECFADLEDIRADEAGAPLRAVADVPSSSSALQVAKRFRRSHLHRAERAVARADGGHENLPVDGHRISPLADTKPPQWRPSDLPTEN